MPNMEVLMNKNEKSKFNLELIISLVIVMITILGSTIPLYLHTSSQIQAIQTEMKDFHTRLAVQDLEFKMRLCSIEENKGK